MGECGLDYHYDHSPRDVQREVFAAQIALAHRHDRALVIHTREAWDDTFAILDEAGVPERTVFHCFTGGAAEAERALALGAHLSFSGIVTFPSADDVRDAARLCPDDRLLVETDAPVPHPGAAPGQAQPPGPGPPGRRRRWPRSGARTRRGGRRGAPGPTPPGSTTCPTEPAGPGGVDPRLRLCYVPTDPVGHPAREGRCPHIPRSACV